MGVAGETPATQRAPLPLPPHLGARFNPNDKADPPLVDQFKELDIGKAAVCGQPDPFEGHILNNDLEARLITARW